MQNTRLDEEKRQWLHIISVFERDGTVSNYVEKLVPKTCAWAEKLQKEKREGRNPALCLTLSNNFTNRPTPGGRSNPSLFGLATDPQLFFDNSNSASLQIIRTTFDFSVEY